MLTIADLFDLFVHIDQHLMTIIQNYGLWSYGLLFAILFCETGLVVTPFLPGDSLLFAAGSFAAMGSLDLSLLLGLLVAAAVIGDSVNYALGHYVGKRAFEGNIPLVKQKHLLRTQEFYARYGAKTILLARFIPIVRTFAPLVAGIGQMAYRRFFIYNVVGGAFWVSFFLLVGFLFGNLPVVRRNFSLVVVAIIFISVLPLAVEWLKHRRAVSRSAR